MNELAPGNVAFHVATDRLPYFGIPLVECNQTVVGVVDTDGLVNRRQNFGYELGAKAIDDALSGSSVSHGLDGGVSRTPRLRDADLW